MDPAWPYNTPNMALIEYYNCLNFYRLYIRFQALIAFGRLVYPLGYKTRVEGALMDLHGPKK